MRAAVYARVSTADQTCENQLRELRAYCQARGLTATEFMDRKFDLLVHRHHKTRRPMWFHVLAVISEFEPARIAERVRVAMARAKASGKHVGRKLRRRVTDADMAALDGLSVREVASRLGVSKASGKMRVG